MDSHCRSAAAGTQAVEAARVRGAKSGDVGKATGIGRPEKAVAKALCSSMRHRCWNRFGSSSPRLYGEGGVKGQGRTGWVFVGLRAGPAHRPHTSQIRRSSTRRRALGPDRVRRDDMDRRCTCARRRAPEPRPPECVGRLNLHDVRGHRVQQDARQAVLVVAQAERADDHAAVFGGQLLLVAALQKIRFLGGKLGNAMGLE